MMWLFQILYLLYPLSLPLSTVSIYLSLLSKNSEALPRGAAKMSTACLAAAIYGGGVGLTQGLLTRRAISGGGGGSFVSYQNLTCGRCRFTFRRRAALVSRGGREGGREVYLPSRLLKRTVLVSRAQTVLASSGGRGGGLLTRHVRGTDNSLSGGASRRIALRKDVLIPLPRKVGPCA